MANQNQYNPTRIKVEKILKQNNPGCDSKVIMPHICGPHSNLPNCRYYDRYNTEENPNWVQAAGTGTMDKQKRFPRPQMTQQWEPKSDSANTGPSNNDCKRDDTAKLPVSVPIEREPPLRHDSQENWVGKKKSFYIQPQRNTPMQIKINKPVQVLAQEENIFPRKRRSDLKPQM